MVQKVNLASQRLFFNVLPNYKNSIFFFENFFCFRVLLDSLILVFLSLYGYKLLTLYTSFSSKTYIINIFWIKFKQDLFRKPKVFKFKNLKLIELPFSNRLIKKKSALLVGNLFFFNHNLDNQFSSFKTTKKSTLTKRQFSSYILYSFNIFFKKFKYKRYSTCKFIFFTRMNFLKKKVKVLKKWSFKKLTFLKEKKLKIFFRNYDDEICKFSRRKYNTKKLFFRKFWLKLKKKRFFRRRWKYKALPKPILRRWKYKALPKPILRGFLIWRFFKRTRKFRLRRRLRKLRKVFNKLKFFLFGLRNKLLLKVLFKYCIFFGNKCPNSRLCKLSIFFNGFIGRVIKHLFVENLANWKFFKFYYIFDSFCSFFSPNCCFKKIKIFKKFSAVFFQVIIFKNNYFTKNFSLIREKFYLFLHFKQLLRKILLKQVCINFFSSKALLNKFNILELRANQLLFKKHRFRFYNWKFLRQNSIFFYTYNLINLYITSLRFKNFSLFLVFFCTELGKVKKQWRVIKSLKAFIKNSKIVSLHFFGLHFLISGTIQGCLRTMRFHIFKLLVTSLENLNSEVFFLQRQSLSKYGALGVKLWAYF